MSDFDDFLPAVAERTMVLSVSGATDRIKERIEEIRELTVVGEATGCYPPNASGHLYFSIRDEHALLRVTFFSYARKAQADFQPIKNGDKVVVVGKIGVYAPKGSYALTAKTVTIEGGVGVLIKRFNALKQKLLDEGLCVPCEGLVPCTAIRHRPLPKLPKRVGIVTAATGAAIRDMLTILGRRFPNLHIVIANAFVQGPDAVPSIVKGIQTLNQHFGPTSDEPLDAIIVGRGGGSMEDLWAFNEEPVVRAVWASKIPIISAVGHEPDIVLTDFVADLRASTPSAAAELLCGRKEDLERDIQRSKDRLIRVLASDWKLLQEKLQRSSASLTNAQERILSKSIERVAQAELAIERKRNVFIPQLQQRFNNAEARMRHATLRAIDVARARIATQQRSLATALAAELQRRTATVELLDSKLKAYNFEDVLRRGYALVRGPHGAVITSAQQVPAATLLKVQFSDGQVDVRSLGKKASPVDTPADQGDDLFS